MPACNTPRSSIARGFVNVLFGQSYHLFGQNSFAVPDAVNTGLNSGLETNRSDYVARVAYQPDNIYTFISRFLLDENTFQVRRVEVEGRANFDRWQLTALYGNYDEQPEIGFLERRQGVTGTGHVQVHAELERAGVGALRPRGAADQPAPHRPRLYRRLLCYFARTT